MARYHGRRKIKFCWLLEEKGKLYAWPERSGPRKDDYLIAPDAEPVGKWPWGASLKIIQAAMARKGWIVQETMSQPFSDLRRMGALKP